MALDFCKYIDDEMKSIGYSTQYEEVKPTHAFIRFKAGLGAAMDGGKSFAVYYIRKPIKAEWIREAFKANYPMSVLFVVDQMLLADVKSKIALKQAVPLWLRALHAIYYGRIYTWLNFREGLKAFHVDWNKSDFAYSDTIVIDKMVFTETDCKLRDFPGQFKIARFTDDAFWTRDPNAPPRAKKEKKPPYEPPAGSYEDYARKYYQQGFGGYQDPRRYSSWQDNSPPKDMPREGESFNDYFKRIFEEDLRRRQAHNPPPPPPRRRTSYQVDDKWLAQMLATGNKDGAQKVYRDLARKYHPDVNKEPGALETMQAINNAYDKAKVMLS